MAEPVILTNGVFMNTTSWSALISALATRYCVVTYDMRGQKQSGKPVCEAYDFATHAADLCGLMAALDIHATHLVGTSYGGRLNLHMALHHADRVRSITIIASVADNPPLTSAMIQRWKRAAQIGDGALFFDLIHADVYSERTLARQPELIDAARARYGALDLPAAERLLNGFTQFDTRARLNEITVPTCIVAAEHDRLFPREHVEAIHHGILGSEFHLVANAAHVCALEQPEPINTLVLGFLAKHTTAK